MALDWQIELYAALQSFVDLLERWLCTVPGCKMKGRKALRGLRVADLIPL